MATAKKLGQVTSTAKKQNIDGNFKAQSPTRRHTANDYMNAPKAGKYIEEKGTDTFTKKLGTN